MSNVPPLVAAFREIMSDETYTAEKPSSEMCRAVIEYRAAQLPEGPELWALWHVEHGTQVASLCEFDGSICFECYVNPAQAWREAARLNASGYSASGRYVVARIPAGVAGDAGRQSVRASGPVVAWRGGFDCGYTTCEADLSDLDVLQAAPEAPAAQSPRARYRAERIAAHDALRAVPWSDRAAPVDGSPICRLYVYGYDEGAEQGRIVADIMEADMSAEQFQRHFMSKGRAWFNRGEELDKGREYQLFAGTYQDGAPFFPFDKFGTLSRI